MSLAIEKTIHQRGRTAENIACDYLLQQGLRIIERNYRKRSGEIDIIAQHRSILVFAEVKYRTTDYFGAPSESVTPQKKQKIINTAHHYLYAKGISPRQICRFDVISITAKDNHDVDIRWYKDAFREGE